MFNTRRAKILFNILLIISILFPIIIYPQLPYRVASHFGPNNKADDWMIKSKYMIVHFLLIFSISGLFAAMAKFIHKLPASIINLPNKDYWLTEERKEKTFLILQGMFYWIGNLCLLLFLYVFYQVYKANITANNQLDSFAWFAIIIFLAGNGYIIMKYISFFNNKNS